jgi:release factor glutamine methyltransferase
VTSPGKKWTIKEVLKWTTAYFKEKGIDAPRLTAEYLLAHALKTNRLKLYLNYDKPLNSSELSIFKALIKRRLAHEPLAYITGEHTFWTLSLKITPAVLIPRPETEMVVEISLGIVRKYRLKAPFILDWGTGSGAIALALAKELPEAKVVGTDLSFLALKIAKENAFKHQIALSLVQSKDLTPFKPCLFDLIVSNPPYIKSKDIPNLAPEVRDYEPREALDGGEDGLKYIKYLLQNAHLYLKRKAWLVMEIGYDQAEAVAALVKEMDIWVDCQFFKDYAGIKRVVVLETDR